MGADTLLSSIKTALSFLMPVPRRVLLGSLAANLADVYANVSVAALCCFTHPHPPAQAAGGAGQGRAGRRSWGIMCLLALERSSERSFHTGNQALSSPY